MTMDTRLLTKIALKDSNFYVAEDLDDVVTKINGEGLFITTVDASLGQVTINKNAIQYVCEEEVTFYKGEILK